MIYFIQEGNDGPVKIGTTTDVNSRFNSIQCGNPRKLHLLVVIDGGSLEEKALHQHFELWRIRGEWFQPVTELIELIGSLDSIEYSVEGIYTIRIPDELRIAIDSQAALEPGVSGADVARRWLEMGRTVQGAGFDTLGEFCKNVSLETLDDWTKDDDNAD